MPKEDRAWTEYSADFRTRVLPRLLDSAVMLSILDGGHPFDVRQATELGACLLLDKPLLLVVPRGASIPDRLRRLADKIVDDFDAKDPTSAARLTAALDELQPRLRRSP